MGQAKRRGTYEQRKSAAIEQYERHLREKAAKRIAELRRRQESQTAKILLKGAQ
jgi:hypothetical protein